MELIKVAGPCGVEPLEDGENGKCIVVMGSPHKRTEIPIPKELAHTLAEYLVMDNEALGERLQREAKETEVKAKLHMPNGARFD